MRITCPECAMVMRPAKPIAAGKKVRCPKCGTTFGVVDTGADEPTEKVKAASTSAAVKKKSADIAKSEKKPEKKPEKLPEKPPDKPAAPKLDEDGEPMTYGIKGAGDAHKEEEGGEPKINHELDKSIKDLRGPTQMAVGKPTNFLIALGAIGFLGWIALLVIFAIPVMFPIELDEGTKEYLKPMLRFDTGFGAGFGKLGEDFVAPIQASTAPPVPGEVKGDKENVSLYKFLGTDYSQVAQYAWYVFVIMMTPIYLGMGYTAIQTYGAVRAQNLESRQWGMAASIMALIPYNLGGAAFVVGMAVSFGMNMVLDEEETINMMVYGVFGIISLISIGAGVVFIKTLMLPEVIAGYEFVPDHEKIEKGEKKDKKDKPKRKKQR